MAVIKFFFQSLIVLGGAGIVFHMFDWKTASGIVALVFLVTIQVLLIAAKTTIRKKNGSVLNSSKKRKTVSAPVSNTRQKIRQSGAPETIDSEIFSKFQQSLSQSSQPEAVEEQDVVLSLSSKTKASSSPSSPAASKVEENGARVAELLKKTIKEAEKKRITQESSIAEKLDNMPIEPLGSIFDDLEEPEEPGNNRKIKPHSKIKKEQSASAQGGYNRVKKEQPATRPEPLLPNEELNFDFADSEKEDAVDDEEVIVSLVKDFIKDQNYSDALNTINRYYDSCALDDAKEIKDRDIIRMKGECEFELGEYLKASKSWQELFNKYLKPKEDGFLPLLEEIMEKFTRQKQQQYAVQFYFTALNEYRQLRNTRRMDDIYAEIEVAYNKMEDWPRLIQTYQNHLTIKKIIKDYKGQIVLLDHLGKLQYDQGDADGSKASYQQSIAIKKQLAKRRG